MQPQSKPALSLGFLYVLSVPVAAAVSALDISDIGGFAYTGWIWVSSMVAMALLIQADMAFRGRFESEFPVWSWLCWFGFVWLSLVWGEGVGRREIQDAVQVTMPVLVGIASAMFVRSESELRLFLRVVYTVPALLVVTVIVSPGTDDGEGGHRVLSLTAALVGCVFLAGFPHRRVVPLLGWASCLALTVVTGSRMATLALVAVPAVHPLCRSLLARGLIGAGLVALAAGLFYLPVFQERFFFGGYGGLEDLFAGDYLDFGRYDAWVQILAEGWRHPTLGAGVGSTYDFVPRVWPGMRMVHNDYLRIFFELGAVGLAIFAVVVLRQVVALVLAAWRSSGDVQLAFAASAMGFAVFLLTAVTDNPLAYNLWFTNPLFALMGAAYGARAAQRGTDSEPTPIVVRSWSV